MLGRRPELELRPTVMELRLSRDRMRARAFLQPLPSL